LANSRKNIEEKQVVRFISKEATGGMTPNPKEGVTAARDARRKEIGKKKRLKKAHRGMKSEFWGGLSSFIRKKPKRGGKIQLQNYARKLWGEGGRPLTANISNRRLESSASWRKKNEGKYWERRPGPH